MDGERRFSEMSKMDPKEVVRAGCDAVSYAYRDDVEDEDCAGYHAWLDELEPHLPPSVPVLDVGCGCGIPVAKRLAATHPVTGVDISPVQIERARSLVPEGRFLCVDITSVSFPAEHFGGIVAFYSLIHVPLEEQPDLLRALCRWLGPGGCLMATVGHRAWTGREENWLGAGAAMYWSCADRATNLRWLAGAGFEGLWTRFIPEEDSGFTLVLARRGAGGCDCPPQSTAGKER